MSTNRVVAHTGARYPILQAPMTYIAIAQLAAAVSEAGGFGLIATTNGVTAAREQLALAAEATTKPFGANILVSSAKDPSVVDVIADAGVRFVTTSAGNPSTFIGPLKDRGITVYHVVPSVTAAERAVEAGVDGLVVEGGEGGGFKSPDDVSTLVLLPAVRRAVDVPLIAAGGIGDGAGMAAAFALGAEGVQLGTRFLVTAESPIHPSYKEALRGAGVTDTVMLNRMAKPAVRALKTVVSDRIMAEAGGRIPPEAFAGVQDLYFQGDLTRSVASAGQVVGLIDDVPTVADLIDRIVEGFFTRVRELAERHGGGSF